MRIAQLCPRYRPDIGGIQTHVEAISKQLTSLGVDVEIYTTDPSGKLPRHEEIDGVNVHRFRSYSFRDLYYFSPSLLSGLMDLEDVDIVHAHSYQEFCTLAAVCAKRSFRKPLVFTPHFHPTGSSKLRTIGKRFYALTVGGYLFQKSDAVVAVSRYEKQLLAETFQLSERKITYIPNGINVENYKLSVRDNHSHKKSILCVGRLEEYKGVQYLIEAFPIVKEKVKDVQLVIVGDGSHKKRLVALADHLNIRKDVHFLGYISDSQLTNLYLTSSLFVMPSAYEAFCIALVEAMAHGLPVIATKVGAMSELIGKNLRGFLIDYPPDVKTLADMESLLLNDSDLSCKISHAARDYVLATFSWRSTAENLLKVYTELCIQK